MKRRIKEIIKRNCAREECGKEFIANTVNQKFCSKSCCQIATNRNLLLKYHEKKRPIGLGRVCGRDGCTTLLSRYNKTNVCEPCQLKDQQKKLLKD